MVVKALLLKTLSSLFPNQNSSSFSLSSGDLKISPSALNGVTFLSRCFPLQILQHIRVIRSLHNGVLVKAPWIRAVKGATKRGTVEAKGTSEMIVNRVDIELQYEANVSDKIERKVEAWRNKEEVGATEAGSASVTGAEEKHASNKPRSFLSRLKASLTSSILIIANDPTIIYNVDDRWALIITMKKWGYTEDDGDGLGKWEDVEVRLHDKKSGRERGAR